MSETKHTVLNCTDSPQPCEYCGATVPPNSDHGCPDLEMGHPTAKPMSPHERAVEVVVSSETWPWLTAHHKLASSPPSLLHSKRRATRTRRGRKVNENLSPF